MRYFRKSVSVFLLHFNVTWLLPAKAIRFCGMAGAVLPATWYQSNTYSLYPGSIGQV